MDRHERRMAPRLSALLDGDVGRLRGRLLRSHISRCARCQRGLGALEAQIAALRGLHEAPLPPARDDEEAGWLALQRALRASPPEPAPVPRPAAPRARFRPAPILALPVAGLAAIVALVVVRPARLFERPPSDDVLIGLAEEEFRQAEQHYQHAVEQLLRVSAHARPRWSAGEQRAYEERLGTLRRTTERHRTTARSHPADAEVQEQLYAAYRRQIAYLQVSLRSGPSAAERELSRTGGGAFDEGMTP